MRRAAAECLPGAVVTVTRPSGSMTSRSRAPSPRGRVPSRPSRSGPGVGGHPGGDPRRGDGAGEAMVAADDRSQVTFGVARREGAESREVAVQQADPPDRAAVIRPEIQGVERQGLVVAGVEGWAPPPPPPGPGPADAPGPPRAGGGR